MALNLKTEPFSRTTRPPRSPVAPEQIAPHFPQLEF